MNSVLIALTFQLLFFCSLVYSNALFSYTVPDASGTGVALADYSRAKAILVGKFNISKGLKY
jgi:hypothetical protein